MRDSSFCQLPRDRNIEFTIYLLISFIEIEHSYKGIRFNYQSTYECSFTYNGVFSESSLKEPKKNYSLFTPSKTRHFRYPECI